MKKVFRYLLIGVAVLVVIIGAGLLYIVLALPNVGDAPALTIERTPERIERGRYLANAVTVCMDCHSKRDFSLFSGPPVAGTTGMGGERFGREVGLPGEFYSGNITPEGIGRYTDGELVRVITTGVNKEGHAMFPLMPYPYYGSMDTEDIYSIVAYVRSLPVVSNTVPKSTADFPVNIIIHTIPKTATPQPKPDEKDVLAYGAYLLNAAACRECHTQAEKGQIIKELAFSGGREFKFPDGSIVRSSNITPDAESGLGKWTSEAFINRFKLYQDSTFKLPSTAPGEFNTPMPWTMYSKMKREDLAAIFAYLQTVKSISNKIEKFTESEKKPLASNL